MSYHHWLYRRESGFSSNFGDINLLKKRVYTSTEPFSHFGDSLDKDTTSECGAVFNLEFSPEGNVLVAACEKRSILLFDTVTTNQINKITDAHTDNVNCIKFLDNRSFATCSDDTTVALWDLRNLKMKVRSLHGHANWVKNIEYSQSNHLLVTAGFDGSILTWDITSHTEQGLIYQKVFHTSGLMRCRLTPDGTKLIICTTGGYLMIVHDLDLTTLHKDLCGFRPSIYRLMQMGHQYIPQAAKFDHVFAKTQKKNRVELVTDFPDNNDAEVILALQIHPHGHCFLSRNISYDERTEWSCVHDIVEEPGDLSIKLNEPTSKRKRKFLSDSDDDEPSANNRLLNEPMEPVYDERNPDEVLFSIDRRQRAPRVTRATVARGPLPPPRPIHQPTSRMDAFVPDIWAAEVTVQERAIRQNRARSSTTSVTGYNFVYAISSGVLTGAEAIAASAVSSAASRRAGPLSRRIFSHNRTLSNDSRTRSDSPNPNASLNESSGSSGTSNNDARRAFTNTSSTNDSRIRLLLPTTNHLSEGSGGSSSTSNREARRNFFNNARRNQSPNNATTTDGSSSTSSSDSVSLPSFEHYRALIEANSKRNLIKERQIFQNPKKLMYYVQESNNGKGFIKEPGFSADGRIICSPYNTGVRLLGFNDECPEYPRYNSPARGGMRNPIQLAEVKTISSHSDIVLSTKFSPREPLLVTGCRSGKIVWYHPNF